MEEKQIKGINITDPLEYLKAENYVDIFDDLQKYIQDQSFEVPQMGETNIDIVSRFHDVIKTFLYRTLHLTANSKSVPQDIQARIDAVVYDMAGLLRGFGPLQKYMAMDDVEEIIVRNGSVLIERGGRINLEIDNSNNPRNARLLDTQFTILGRRIADLGKVPLSDVKPYAVSVVPETNDRFGVIIPPLSNDFTSINIRVFPKRGAYTMKDLQSSGTFAGGKEFARSDVGRVQNTKTRYDGYLQATLASFVHRKKVKEGKPAASAQEAAYLLTKNTKINDLLDSIPDDAQRHEFERMSNEIGKNVAIYLAYIAYLNLATVLLAGEFSSGKTTILNAMSYFVRQDQMVSVIEDYYELKIQHKYAMRLVTYKQFDQGTIINTVITRMRPDLIIVGELVEKGQSFEFLNASNFGKKSWSTIHSNDALSSLIRLENLATIEGYTPYEIRRRIINSVDMVVHMGAEAGSRFVNEIGLVNKSLDSRGEYQMTPLYRSGRRGSRLDLLQALWLGVKEQD